MAWEPIATGVAATALAALQLMAWVALGSFFVAGEREPRIALPVALLIGVSITGCVYPLLAWAGLVHLSLAIVPAGCLAAIAVRFTDTCRLLGYAVGAYERMCDGRRWARWLAAAGIALFWLIAIAPPRDADAMRYHLAKIRLLDLEGLWTPILHFCHSLPFGWAIHYLPFEHLGIPQGGHLLNLGLLVIAVGIVNDTVRRLGAGPGLAAMLSALMAFQPWVLKVSTNPYVDMPLHFTMVTLAALFAEDDGEAPSLRRLAFLGFVAWMCAQSRYQAVLVGLTVSLVVLFWAARRRIGLRDVVVYGLGGVAALILSSPYYLYNLIYFQNPVWPLLVRPLNGLDSYANQVVYAYQKGQEGTRSFAAVVASLAAVLKSAPAVPIPAMSFGLIGVAISRRTPGASRTFGLLVAIFLVIYVVFHTTVYSRYMAYLTAWAVVGWAPILVWWSATPLLRRGIRLGLAALLVALVGQALWYAYDMVRYDVTGDARAYHEYTPFWAVYDWVNRETPPDSRHAVVVTSGHSYYLNRVLRQAEPTLSGVVDWPALETPEDLDRAFETAGYDYLIYEDRDWSMDHGGAQMESIVDAAVRAGVLRPVERIDSRLYLSRIQRKWQPIVVYVLERTGGPMAGRVSGSAPWRADADE